MFFVIFELSVVVMLQMQCMLFLLVGDYFEYVDFFWVDSILKFVQVCLIDGFENYDIVYVLLWMSDFGQVDYQLLIDIRCFWIVIDGEVRVEIGLLV